MTVSPFLAGGPFPLTMSSTTSFRGGEPVGFGITGFLVVSFSAASASGGGGSVARPVGGWGGGGSGGGPARAASPPAGGGLRRRAGVRRRGRGPRWGAGRVVAPAAGGEPAYDDDGNGDQHESGEAGHGPRHPRRCGRSRANLPYSRLDFFRFDQGEVTD